jgi:hypothetical protein
MKLELQVNQTAIRDDSRALVPSGILITPHIDEDFWLFRVPVSENQAVVAFPKFMTIGLGFQHEEASWNTNLPYSCGAEEIFRHIQRNRGDDTIPDERCIEAIRLIQNAITALHQPATA